MGTPEEQSLLAISQMTLGQRALIVAFSFETDLGEKIQQMGLIPGEQVEIVRINPIEIKIRGYFMPLSLTFLRIVSIFFSSSVSGVWTPMTVTPFSAKSLCQPVYHG